jgi:hypothetical protein
MFLINHGGEDARGNVRAETRSTFTQRRGVIEDAEGSEKKRWVGLASTLPGAIEAERCGRGDGWRRSR